MKTGAKLPTESLVNSLGVAVDSHFGESGEGRQEKEKRKKEKEEEACPRVFLEIRMQLPLT